MENHLLDLYEEQYFNNLRGGVMVSTILRGKKSRQVSVFCESDSGSCKFGHQYIYSFSVIYLQKGICEGRHDNQLSFKYQGKTS